MRVIAGLAGGRKLKVPPQGTRPTPARVREALFSSLQPCLPQAQVLDLFAGSGALGIEAVSRGAAGATFVEQNAKAAQVLRQNLTVLPQPQQRACNVWVCTVQEALPRLAQQALRFDLVLVDAPFASGLVAATLALVASLQLLVPAGRIVVEHRATQEAPAAPNGCCRGPTRRYGEVALTRYVGYSDGLSFRPES